MPTTTIRVPLPPGTIHGDDYEPQVAPNVHAYYRGQIIGTVAAIRLSEDRTATLFDIELIDGAPTFLGYAVTFLRQTGLDPYRPTLSDADYHDRGRPCDNELCPECYLQDPPPAEPDPDAYIAALEDHLERRELASRLLDRILSHGSTLTDGASTWALRPEAVIELGPKEAAYIRARQAANYSPDTQ